MNANTDTDKPTDLLYLAALSSRKGDKAKAIEYGEEAIRLLLRESPRAAIEIELKLENKPICLSLERSLLS